MMRLKILVIFLFLIFVPFATFAREYDFYVNGSASSGGDGTAEKPFKTISKATKKAANSSGSKSIFVSGGRYAENFTLENSTKLYGESKSATVIGGRITMKNDTLLKDISVEGLGGTIDIEGNADAEIRNCKISKFEKIGINFFSGNGKVTIRDTEIKNGSGKALYIQRGRRVNITNNEITGNNEEGIDVRSKTRGEIKNNLISGNGESGIEIILAGADIRISNNIIKNNGASGIATQYYKSFGSAGDVVISGNKIHHNKKYGIDCNTPQGGSPGGEYWKKTMDLRGNEIYSNKIREASKRCKFVDDTEEEEEGEKEDEKEEIEEEKKDKKALPASKISQIVGEIKRKDEQRNSKARRKLKEANEITKKQEAEIESIRSQVSEIESENKMKSVILGSDDQKIEKLISEIQISEEEIEKAKQLLLSDHLLIQEKELVAERIRNEKMELEIQKQFLIQKREAFNVLDWIKNIFK